MWRHYRLGFRPRYCMIDNVLVAISFGLLYVGITCREIQYFHEIGKKASAKLNAFHFHYEMKTMRDA